MVKTSEDYAAQALRCALRAPHVAEFADELRAACKAERAAGALAARIDERGEVVESFEENEKAARNWAAEAADDARNARMGNNESNVYAAEDAMRAAYCAGYYAEVASW